MTTGDGSLSPSKLLLLLKGCNMDYLELLANRRSCRAFSAQPVTDEQIEKLLLAANGAPAGSNRYNDLHLTVVRNADVLKKLAEASAQRWKDKETMNRIVSTIPSKGAGHETSGPFYGASTVIFVSHRKQDLQPGIEYANAACAVLSMQMEAVQLGLSSVFIWGALEAMRVLPEYDRTDLLELPDGFEPLLGLAVGYALDTPEKREIRGDKISRNYI